MCLWSDSVIYGHVNRSYLLMDQLPKELQARWAYFWNRVYSWLQHSECLGCDCTAGSGSILAMVQTASQRAPDIICGKPYKPMFDVLVNKYNIDPKKTLMIGDRFVFLTLLTCCCHDNNGAQLCEQFLQVGRLDWTLTLLGLALYLPSTSVSSVFAVLYTLWVRKIWTLFYLSITSLNTVCF